MNAYETAKPDGYSLADMQQKSLLDNRKDKYRTQATALKLALTNAIDAG
ncbi:MAG: hypothetical protein KDF59_07310 [Nitrosomonas sp.]|nr:hypothetical protein [Nitrosomonas sp.]